MNRRRFPDPAGIGLDRRLHRRPAILPATTSPGSVLLLKPISMTVFAGGAGSVSNLVPFFVPLGMIRVSGAWKVTTGARVSVIGIGNFT
jgi:hypothetical protein